MASADDKKELLSVPSFCVYKLSGTEFRHRNLQEFRPEGQMASANRCSKYVCLFVLMCNCSFENLIEHTIYQTFNLFSSDQKSWCVSMSNLKVHIVTLPFWFFRMEMGPCTLLLHSAGKEWPRNWFVLEPQATSETTWAHRFSFLRMLLSR